MSKVTKVNIPYRETADLMAKRTLDESFPQLKPYLKSGVKVLDVGCGHGSITLNVADVVKPGEVIGIDAMKEWVDQATEEAEKKKLSNITFRHSDAHNLDFPDDTFDVAFSNHVFANIIDPLLALKEQKRVTKTGGWVIVRAGDMGSHLRHPPCPAFEKVYLARAQYAEYLQTKFKPGDDVPGFYNNPCNMRKCVEWFSKAGLSDLKVEGIPNVRHPGTEDFEPDTWRLSLEGPFSEVYKNMFAEGFLDNETLEQAQKEMDAFYSDPYAILFGGSFVASGRV